jgi:hypothetical protein
MCGAILAKLCPAGAGQVVSFDTRDTDRRRLMTALDAINRRISRDTVFDAGTGIHCDWKAFATSAMSNLPELRHMRSGVGRPSAPSPVWPNGYDSRATAWNRV